MRLSVSRRGCCLCGFRQDDRLASTPVGQWIHRPLLKMAASEPASAQMLDPHVHHHTWPAIPCQNIGLIQAYDGHIVNQLTSLYWACRIENGGCDWSWLCQTLCQASCDRCRIQPTALHMLRPSTGIVGFSPAADSILSKVVVATQSTLLAQSHRQVISSDS